MRRLVPMVEEDPMPLAGIRAVTLDFGNTLVPVDRRALRTVVAWTADRVCADLRLGEPSTFLVAWAEERDRQFREEVPQFREVDLPQRATRVVARMRGIAPPAADVAWDDETAAERSSADDISLIVDAYSEAFVTHIPAPPQSGQVISDLAARGFRLAILSNWPLAATIDRFAAAAGWTPYLQYIFVSQRIGTIKPHPAIFGHAATALAVEPSAILHVGDDWAADIAGALAVGWHAAYLVGHQVDTPLPTSSRSDGQRPDFELGSLGELGAHLSDPTSHAAAQPDRLDSRRGDA